MIEQEPKRPRPGGQYDVERNIPVFGRQVLRLPSEIIRTGETDGIEIFAVEFDPGLCIRR
ncbi:hypothetical protein [Mesorhizobium sp. 1B3]|uniref:hypothetical protein n=1 Tax=Mesorhizobium sp. 1B3 TaxID=3243599 RepID=UPI003D9647BE